jgi:flavin-dependent dehydrogenase
MYDVIVVGARVAGASTAMLLARKGVRVLLVDRATFPSDIPHGHFIHRHGPKRLARWGLLDRVVATGSPPIKSVVSDLQDFPLESDGLEVDGVALGYAPRRFALDKVLVDAAVEAGVELRTGFVVEEFLADGDRVVGVRSRPRGFGGVGSVAERATFVVGADGRNSRLAKFVRTPAREATPPVACWYFSYWSGVPLTALELHMRADKGVFAFPTNDGLYFVAVSWPAAELPAVRADIESRFMAALDEVPRLAEAVRAGRREERFYGATDVPNFLRKPQGPGWALVGDAGVHKDPFLALGICDALRDAELLADAIEQTLSGRRPEGDAMADYERRRDEATLPDYRTNLHLARFQPPPEELLRIRLAVLGDTAATRQFFLASQGMVPRESFFNPENIERLLRSAEPTLPLYSPIVGDQARPARRTAG